MLTPQQAQGLLAALKIISPRMWQMSVISLHCGLRFGEVAALTRHDVDFKNMTLLIRDPKSGVDRYAIMTASTATVVRMAMAESASDLLFPGRGNKVMGSPSDAFSRTVQALEMNISATLDERGRPVEITDNRLRVVFHSWRHTYGSWLGAAGDAQKMIADRLGQSSADMSERYTHIFSPARRRTAVTIEHMFRHGTPPPREDIDLSPDHVETPEPRR